MVRPSEDPYNPTFEHEGEHSLEISLHSGKYIVTLLLGHQPVPAILTLQWRKDLESVPLFRKTGHVHSPQSPSPLMEEGRGEHGKTNHFYASEFMCKHQVSSIDPISWQLTEISNHSRDMNSVKNALSLRNSSTTLRMTIKVVE